MKQLYLFVLTLVTSIATAQIVNIPDANFKDKLVNSASVSFIYGSPDYVDADTNNDGEIQVSEAEAVEQMHIGQIPIASVTGLEAFVNLKSLSLPSVGLTDLSPAEGLTQLRYLNCNSNNLTEFNLDQLVNLETFKGPNNEFVSLDFSNTKMTVFDFNGCWYLQYLNIKNGYQSVCNYGPDDGCMEWFGMTNLQAVCRDEGELDYPFGNFYTPLPWGVINSYCTFGPAGEHNVVSGSINYDCAGTPVPVRFTMLNVQEGETSVQIASNSVANYVYHMGTGTVTIAPNLETSGYFSISPASFTYDFTSLNNNITADFCIVANGFNPDLKVTLIPLTPARPGFDADYKVLLENKGTEPQSGAVSLTYNGGVLDFVSADPNTDSQTTNSLTWNYTNLLPFHSLSWNITLNLNAPTETPAVNNGDILAFSAAVSSDLPDDSPADNTFDLNQTVVGSYDPNNKAVLQGSSVPINQAAQFLHYLVRFQNTGTYPAENVVIRDELSLNLNPATIEILSASHDFRLTLSDRSLKVFFENIDLPAETDDEPASHGYVLFKVKPIAPIAVGSTIENTAEIYFDFNYPIITNTVSTTIVPQLSVNDNDSKYLTIYPNPAKSEFTIAVRGGDSVDQVRIYNNLGQLVKIVRNPSNIVSISELSVGTYLVKIETTGGHATKQLIKI